MKIIKRALSALIASATLFNAAAFDAGQWSWGSISAMSETQVAPGATYRSITVESPIGPQSINAIEFNPQNENITLRAGLSHNQVNGTQTVAGMAKDFNEKGEGQVVAGINADFFNMGQGVPFGLFMDEGEILSTPPTYSAAFGIKNDGTAFCREHGTILDKVLVINEQKMQLSGINNRHSAADSIILYNDKFDKSTKASSDSVEVLLTVLSGELRHGEVLSLSVDEIYTEGGNAEIPLGKMVLSAKGTYRDTLLALEKGQEIAVEIRFIDFWSDVKLAVAGNRQILKDGEIYNAEGTERAPRTVIGIKPDGNVVFYTIDGRLPGFSVGATYAQAAQIMQSLGCVDAINLDGGGSTTFALRYLGAQDAKMINRSADYAARAVANGLLLVNTATPTAPEKMILSAPTKKVLLGGTYQITAVGGIDSNYLSYPIDKPVEWQVNEYKGAISEDGIFAPAVSGETRISATDGEIAGELYMTVIDSPDAINHEDSIVIKADETKKFTLSLTHEGENVSFSNDLLDWQVEGDIGEFTAPGIFVAASLKASGNITVTRGETSKTIAVEIDGPEPEPEIPVVFEDMSEHMWANEAVYNLFTAGIVRGISDTQFAPQNDIKRADFILLLVRLMGIEIDTEIKTQFDDVPVGSYYYNELATAKRLGIARGTSDTTFAPERRITREEMFTLTWRVLDMQGAAEPTVLDAFSDKADIAEYAREAIALLTESGLIEGDNNGCVNPKKSATRAEAAVFLNRIFKMQNPDTDKGTDKITQEVRNEEQISLD